ncbi:MAG: hypothetical protein GEU80_12350 [Dehalococcoidia bacterium]|nr:hypothetical protein [Dehalococcoidia bacterium]
MSSADELRQSIAANRAAFRAALESLDGANWEETPSGEEEWTRQRIAQHTIGSERFFAGKIAEAMQGKGPERTPLEIASAQEAVAALEAASADADKVFRYVEDRDLQKPAEQTPGVTLPATVEGVMQQTAVHLAEHTSQLTGGA